MNAIYTLTDYGVRAAMSVIDTSFRLSQGFSEQEEKILSEIFIGYYLKLFMMIKLLNVS